MKLFITGGAGFIGSNFVHYWLETYPEDEVLNYDLLTYAGVRESLEDVESLAHYNFVQGDIRDMDVVMAAMEGSDVVVHFAAETHVDRSVLGPLVFSYTNVIGTHVLLEAARKCGIHRFHHVSTDEVFGALSLDDTEKFHETRRYAPNSPYAASKAASDHIVRAYFKTYELPITISNTSNNIGPYQYPEKVVPLFITNAIDDKPLPIYGDGKSLREYIHVLDHCMAIDLIIRQGTVGETYCVGGLEEKNTIEVATAILDVLDKPHDLIAFVPDRPGHDRRYAIYSSKVETELSWKPQFTFDSLIKDTVQWYVDHEDWWRPLKEQSGYREYSDQQYAERLKHTHGNT